MKRFRFAPFLLLLLMSGSFLQSCSETKANAETKFWVRGNCEMCKKTIETALNDVSGVAAASYNLAANEAVISFDSAQTDVDALHQAVANAGYETQSILADPGAYNDLPLCCKKKEDQ